MIHRSSQVRHRASSLQMLSLRSYRGNVPFVHNCLFLRSWPPVDSTVAAVVADTVHSGVDHGCVVHIVNVGDVHITR